MFEPHAFSDEVRVSPELLLDYEEKIKYFFDEHLHNDDEVRYVIDGCGYFDVRDKSVRLNKCHSQRAVTI